jgi:hypothetical protein
MAVRSSRPSSWFLLAVAVAATATATRCFTGTNAFATTTTVNLHLRPSSASSSSSSSSFLPVATSCRDHRRTTPPPPRGGGESSRLFSSSKDDRGGVVGEDDDKVAPPAASSPGAESAYYTPSDRPILAAVDAFGLVLFAAIGKSSHGGGGGGGWGGGIDDVTGGSSLGLLLDNPVVGVLSTALPFVAAWMTTSPFTGVYSPDDESSDEDVLSNAARKVGGGWIVAVPLGIALRGVAGGYAPPVSFAIVTMISTFVILAGLRILYLVAEDFFVEWRNFN